MIDDFVMDIAKYVVKRALKELDVSKVRVYDDGEEVFVKIGKKTYGFSPLQFVTYLDIKTALDNIYTRRCGEVLDLINGR